MQIKRRGSFLPRLVFNRTTFDYSSRRVPAPPHELLLLEGEELHTVYFSLPFEAAAAA